MEATSFCPAFASFRVFSGHSFGGRVFPIRLLLSQKFDSVDKIADVGMPVLFVHGTSDRYVPARFSEELYAAAAEPKKLLLIEGGTHNNAMRAAVSAAQ